MQTQEEHDDQWPYAYDATGAPLYQPPTHLRPSTTVIIYEPYVRGMEVTWRVVCQHRADNHHWSFIGGAQEIGESLPACAIREAYEETGLRICLERLVCVDSDPAHGAIMQYPDGNVVQYTNCTFLARCLDPDPQRQLRWASEEATEVAWFPVLALPQPFTLAHQWRLHQALMINQHPPVR